MGEKPIAMRTDEPREGQASEDDPAKIRAGIVETRAEMAETIDAIEEKLSPQRIVDEAKQAVHDATVGKVTTMMNTVTDKAADVGEQVQEQAQQAVSYVRDNPVPALLIGAGVAWLLMRSRGGRPAYGGRSAYEGYSRGSGYRVREDTRAASATGTAWAETASDTAGRVQQRVAEYGRSAETTLERWLRENPLTVGTVALAAGAVVGLGLPRTRTEDAWMGEARDTLVERAQETAQQAVEKVGEVAEEVQQSAAQASQVAGDVSEQLGGTAREPETKAGSTSRAKTSARGV
jgi:ElaB/YqjD/DUF883 family membrane-anchored ribosome-binding protein